MRWNTRNSNYLIHRIRISSRFSTLLPRFYGRYVIPKASKRKPSNLLSAILKSANYTQPILFSQQSIIKKLKETKDFYGSIMLHPYLASLVEKEVNIPVPRFLKEEKIMKYFWTGGTLFFGLDETSLIYLFSNNFTIYS